MLLKSFKAEQVYNYLDFNINFNNDISFLVGGNGSGKTTALKLMNALISPNFKDLLQIPFKSALLELEVQGEKITIGAEEHDDLITLKISNVESVLSFPAYSNVEFEYYSHGKEKLGKIIEEFNREFSDHDIIKAISQIQSPIFLGLDRRNDSVDRYKEDYYLERQMWLSSKSKRTHAAKRLIRGSLGASLMETEVLVQNSYKRLRELEDRLSGRLRDGILISAFQYSEFDVDNMKPDMANWKEKNGLLKRQKEIKDAIYKIESKDSKLSLEVDCFFERITALFESLSNEEDKEGGISIEWLLNKAQIERIFKIVEIIDDHKSKLDALFKPINDFLSTINSFFSASNKELSIDTVGHLMVKRPDGSECSIEGLSSGERQLLIIFSHLFFSRHSGRKMAFIIDEPELSLHLGWQEKFAETIFSISPKTQFILATHSPEIVGINKDKTIKCR